MYVFNILTNTYKSFAREQKQSLEDLPIFCVVRMRYLTLWEKLVPHLKGQLIVLIFQTRADCK